MSAFEAASITHQTLSGVRGSRLSSGAITSRRLSEDSPTDGMLVEFKTVVDAVRCAAELQRAMIEREAVGGEDRGETAGGGHCSPRAISSLTNLTQNGPKHHCDLD